MCNLTVIKNADNNFSRLHIRIASLLFLVVIEKFILNILQSSPDADMVKICNNLLSEKYLLECQLREAKRQNESLEVMITLIALDVFTIKILILDNFLSIAAQNTVLVD